MEAYNNMFKENAISKGDRARRLKQIERLIQQYLDFADDEDVKKLDYMMGFFGYK